MDVEATLTTPQQSHNFIDDNPDYHRCVPRPHHALRLSMEHAYRQSMPDSYGVGLGMMGGLGGGMGINNMPGAAMMLYGRGTGYGVSPLL